MSPVSTAQILQSQSGSRSSLAAFWQRTRGADLSLRKDRSSLEQRPSDFARELSARDQTDSPADELADAASKAPAADEDAESDPIDESSRAEELNTADAVAADSILAQDANGNAALVAPNADPLAQAVYQAALSTIDPVLAGASVTAQSQYSMRTAGAARQQQAQFATTGHAGTLSAAWQQSDGAAFDGDEGVTDAAARADAADRVGPHSADNRVNQDKPEHAAQKNLSGRDQSLLDAQTAESPREQAARVSFNQRTAESQQSSSFSLAASAWLPTDPASTSAKRHERAVRSEVSELSTSLDQSASAAADRAAASSSQESPSGQDQHHQGKSSHQDATTPQGSSPSTQASNTFALFTTPGFSSTSSAYAAYQSVNTLQTERAIFAAMQAGQQQPGASQEVVLRLFPAKLGSMNLRVTLDQGSSSKPSVRIQLSVESQQAKEAMQPTLAGLQAALSKQGFTQTVIDLSIDPQAATTTADTSQPASTTEWLGLDDVA